MTIRLPTDAAQGMEAFARPGHTLLTDRSEVSAMTVSTAWKAGLLLGLGTFRGTGQPRPIKIPIVIYDTAAVGTKTLFRAEQLTGRILRAAGLEAEWSTGSIADLKRLKMDFTARDAGECNGIFTPSLLRVQILPRAPVGVPLQALGFSLPCAMTGIQVIVYADRVAAASQQMAPTFSRVLGYTLAHELGHVLIHSARHEDSGLMKGIWSKVDWQRAAVDIVPFSPGQARRIRAAVPGAADGGPAQRASLYHH